MRELYDQQPTEHKYSLLTRTGAVVAGFALAGSLAACGRNNGGPDASTRPSLANQYIDASLLPTVHASGKSLSDAPEALPTATSLPSLAERALATDESKPNSSDASRSSAAAAPSEQTTESHVNQNTSADSQSGNKAEKEALGLVTALKRAGQLGNSIVFPSSGSDRSGVVTKHFGKGSHTWSADGDSMISKAKQANGLPVASAQVSFDNHSKVEQVNLQAGRDVIVPNQSKNDMYYKPTPKDQSVTFEKTDKGWGAEAQVGNVVYVTDKAQIKGQTFEPSAQVSVVSPDKIKSIADSIIDKL